MYPGTYASSAPDRPAVIRSGSGRGDIVTYRELEDRSNQLAQLWWSLGIRPGDHVAILAENHTRYFEVYWAAMRSGLYLTCVNRHSTPEEIAYVVNDCAAQCLVTTHLLAECVSDAVTRLVGTPLRFMMDGVVDGFESYETAMENRPITPLEHQPRGDVMLYSSGTTGTPKGIRRALTGLEIDDPRGMGTGYFASELLCINESSVYLVPAPMYHSAALQWSAGAQALGATVVLMDRFDAREFLSSIARHSVTHTQVVPTMFVRLLQLPESERAEYDLSSLRSVLHAAAPCPPSVKNDMIAWFGPIVSELYSGTEGLGITFITAPEWLERPGSVGRAVLGIPHICDDHGEPLAAGEVGTVYFERDTMPFEYHNDAEKTTDSQHPKRSGWSTIGNVGYLDTDGYLYLTDRKAFMIISGGVNVYPAEIEACLMSHPQVADVAVFGLPDPEMGECVHAVVEPHSFLAGDDDLVIELRTYLRERLAGYKVPRSIEFARELPRLESGKVKKNDLRAACLGSTTMTTLR
ncbi:acyl-CoA synthetase [Rhodococcus sp. C3V]|uniref:acyl-CoA synthetase n=1 Tax=Rhodococcus sp. C3V TaxID=3034165 RepID=UPI0023E2E24D|nr:acyl-CoA synthetase [Rhodococcus sp. C3V]MDF3319725.1 acyl-CoA synthetase [Rhodococcus sp. C3V]